MPAKPIKSPTLRNEKDDLLLRRVRAALWFILVGTIVLGIAAWAFSPSPGSAWPMPILAETLLILAVLIRLPQRATVAIASGLIGVACAFAVAMLFGWWTRDSQATYMGVLVFTFIAATLVPWGALTQAIVVFLAYLALAGTTYILADVTYGSASVTAFALLTSIYIAFEMAATHARDESAERERKRTAEALLLLESAVEQADDAVLIMTPELNFPGPRVLYVNPAFTKMSGFSSDETGERPLRALFGPGTDSQTITRIRSALAKPEPSIGEGTLHAKDGSPYTVEWHTAPVRNARGEITHLVSINRDVSERNRKETERAVLAERLYASEQEQAQFSTALAHAGEVMISSLDTPILLGKLCELTATLLDCDCSHVFIWRPEESAYIPLYHYGDTAEHWESLRVLKIPADTIETLVQHLTREELVPIPATADFAIAKLFAQHGLNTSLCVGLRRGDGLVGFYAVHYRSPQSTFSPRQEQLAKGIAHLASLALDNARLVEQLERASRVKSDFVATMSHELRTPLNIVMGYQELLLDGAFGSLNEEQSQHLQTAQRRARELLALITATLDISRLDQQRIPLDVQSITVDELFQQVNQDVGEMTLKEGVVFVCEPPAEPATLVTDTTKLKIVLKNLIDNAFKFTDEGFVELAASPVEGGFEFRVTDSGIGIPSDSVRAIFEPFHQLDASSTRRHGGVGLGLYIVFRLITMLQGEIRVESEHGKGTTFIVRLPMEISLSADSIPSQLAL